MHPSPQKAAAQANVRANALAAVLAAVFATFSALPAHSQSAPPDCTVLADNAERLACYDRLHGRATSRAAPAPAPPAARAAKPAATQENRTPVFAVEPTDLSTRWDLAGRSGSLFGPRAYRPVYLMPVTWTDKLNTRPSSPSPGHTTTDDLVLSATEAKYQISLKTKFAHRVFGTPLSLWGGYTQTSRWQVFNGAASRPFRETNYEPELMLVWPLQQRLAGWDLRMASLSLNHESNGRSLPLSRSWNRVIGSLTFERGPWVMELRPWLRLGEAPSDDDNPDIQDHVGRAELLLTRVVGDHAFMLQARHSLRLGERSRGSVQADWVFPLSGALHGYLQAFSGHGESMIDYNQRQNKIGLGVTIAGWR